MGHGKKGMEDRPCFRDMSPAGGREGEEEPQSSHRDRALQPPSGSEARWGLQSRRCWSASPCPIPPHPAGFSLAFRQVLPRGCVPKHRRAPRQVASCRLERGHGLPVPQLSPGSIAPRFRFFGCFAVVVVAIKLKISLLHPTFCVSPATSPQGCERDLRAWVWTPWDITKTIMASPYPSDSARREKHFYSRGQPHFSHSKFRVVLLNSIKRGPRGM